MKTKFKNLFYSVISIYFLFISSFYFCTNAQEIVEQTDMLTKTVNESKTGVSSVSTTTDYTKINVIDFLRTFKNYIFGLIAFISICVFVYNGFRLIRAEGKDEEMKKVFNAFVYSIVGLAIIPLSYVIIQLVTSFNF